MRQTMWQPTKYQIQPRNVKQYREEERVTFNGNYVRNKEHNSHTVTGCSSLRVLEFALNVSKVGSCVSIRRCSETKIVMPVGLISKNSTFYHFTRNMFVWLTVYMRLEVFNTVRNLFNDDWNILSGPTGRPP